MPDPLIELLTLVADILALVWWLGPLFIVIHLLAFVVWRAYATRQEHPDA